MSKLKEKIEQIYMEENYNCAEAIIRACNEVYNLGLNDAGLKMMSGFGSGMYAGNTCGALNAFGAALSCMVIENKAHEELDTIRPAMNRLNKNFKELLTAINCPDVRKVHHKPEIRCLNTCLLAADAMEKTLAELEIRPGA